jgi:hypothetical protein
MGQDIEQKNEIKFGIWKGELVDVPDNQNRAGRTASSKFDCVRADVYSLERSRREMAG